MKLLILACVATLVRGWANDADCGQSQYADAGSPRFEDRIVGGWATLTNEFPYQVSLRTTTGSLFCGGSLISTTRVLTAAHCTSGRTVSNTRVGVGEHQLNQPNLVTISNIRQHTGYNPSTIANDVSVLTLSSAITPGNTMRSVCTPTKTSSGNADGYAGDRLIVTGWGTTSEGGSLASTLRAVDVTGLTIAACRASAYPASWILDGMNCAGETGGGKDACQGDSGGPLVWKNGARFEEVGIVSWGQGCARPNYPGVYADTIYFNSWIA